MTSEGLDAQAAGAAAPVRLRLVVTGVVQGVGFRPHVHRLASARSLVGHVGNDSSSVFIEVEGAPADLAWFEEHLVADAPPLSRIDTVDVEHLSPTHRRGFEIVASTTTEGARTFVSPDVAVCDDCLAELFDPDDHRYRYPFITCTNCGPRFTIVRTLPYDRPNTTMAGFAMCEHCSAQYHDPADRRFHAQPLACASCGPRLGYSRSSSTTAVDAADDDEVIARVQRDLSTGEIVAVKGLGGYHLACDATDDEAIARLRARKGRVDKPFAVMVADLDTARAVVELTAAETAALCSPARPIVLARAREDGVLSELVAPRNPRVGVMLPYTPLHHLLLRTTPGAPAPSPGPLVMTSGNRSDEPLAFEDDDARRRLADLADSFCTHDRPIHVPCDDSVLRIVAGSELPIRRSRGYAPLPVRLPVDVGPTLAVGGELKNTFCIAEGSHAWMSQHIGDMGNLETLAAFERTVALFSDIYAIEARTVAADAHPGYLTRRWADDRDESAVVHVQHHHAHVAALMAECGETGGRPVLGVAFDGTGYGADGAIWGGEFLIVDGEGFERYAALTDVPLPGGDAAIRKPYRVALAALWAAGIEWDERLPPVAACPPQERTALASMLAGGTSCVPTSSMGRLFDAVSSLLGIRHEITYEAQAAIELEHLAARGDGSRRRLRYPLRSDGRIEVRDVVAALVDGLDAGEDAADLAASFHQATVEMVVTIAERARAARGIDAVGLTGGVFQNALLTEATATRLGAHGFDVLLHRLVPPNDGGLALGQALVAASRRPANS